MSTEFPRGGAARLWPVRPRVAIGVGVVLSLAVLLVVPLLLPASGPFTRTFNSMLEHLLRGKFDVDPAMVGKEGFARDGRVYAYWGIIPALVRLPAMVLPEWERLNFTIPSCLIALLWMAAVKLWTVRLVVRHASAMPRSLARAMYLVIALSGAQACFLRFTLYQEVCLWAGLFGAVFVAAAVVAQQRGLGRRELLVMAAAAGGALLTRVSVGIGLVAALGLLFVVEAIKHRADWRGQLRRAVAPLAVLGAACLVTAWINYERWGNPLTFADYSLYLFNANYPDRVARTATYGLFNIERIPFGLIYYFVPVWVLHGSDGRLLLDDMRTRLIDSAELPPSSFFLTDPLLILLGSIALFRWATRRSPGGRQGGAIAAGLAIPPLLMLTAISMCFRYRIDFYPLIEFLAFSGLAMVGRGGRAIRARLVWMLAAVSVVASLTVAVLYIAGKLGPGQELIGQGIGPYYLTRLGIG